LPDSSLVHPHLTLRCSLSGVSATLASSLLSADLQSSEFSQENNHGRRGTVRL
ncbi:hypothetical protein U1Q18_050494, partial [Sarracenia purpurea var. burkii]